MTRVTHRESTVLMVLVSVLTLALVAACGGGGDGDGGSPRTPTTSPTNTAQGPQAREETVSIGQTVWHSGFTLAFGDATFEASEPDALGRQIFSLTIDATFTNNGPDQRRFTAPIVAVVDGNALNLLQGTEIPNVPAGLTSSGVLVYRVAADFEFNNAFLLVGEGRERQASVPLGTGAGELVTLEPGEAPVTGEVSIELLDLEVVSATIRADMPIVYRQAPTGKLALTLDMQATSRKQGNWSLSANNFALVLPNGNAVAVDGSTLGNLPGQAGGLVTDGLYVRFLVDDPPRGTYSLRFTPPSWWLDGDETGEGLEFEFELQ